MNGLTLVYDGRCAACRRLRALVQAEEKYVPVEALRLDAQTVGDRFPGLAFSTGHTGPTVVGDGGRVWRGSKAVRAALWGLRRHRERALSARPLPDRPWVGPHRVRAPGSPLFAELAADAAARRDRPGWLPSLPGLLLGLVLVPIAVVVVVAAAIGLAQGGPAAWIAAGAFLAFLVFLVSPRGRAGPPHDRRTNRPLDVPRR